MARDANGWLPIETAPTDGTEVLCYAPGRSGLVAFQTVEAYHPEVGWCVCEVRDVTHWQPLPGPPVEVLLHPVQSTGVKMTCPKCEGDPYNVPWFGHGAKCDQCNGTGLIDNGQKVSQ